MYTQKQEILEFVAAQQGGKRAIEDVLKTFGVSPSSFYRWKKQNSAGQLALQKLVINPRMLSPIERARILEVKSRNPELRHRRIQGKLQQQGIYISASSIYHELKAQNLVEPYARRESPWDEPLVDPSG